MDEERIRERARRAVTSSQRASIGRKAISQDELMQEASNATRQSRIYQEIDSLRTENLRLLGK